MTNQPIKLWIPPEELETLPAGTGSKRRGGKRILGNIEQIIIDNNPFYTATVEDAGYLGFFGKTHILAAVGQEVLRRERYGADEQAHLFALVSSRQKHSLFPQGLALTTHPELDKFSNQGFEVVGVNLQSDSKPTLDQFVVGAYETYRALLRERLSEKKLSEPMQVALSSRNSHILFYTS